MATCIPLCAFCVSRFTFAARKSLQGHSFDSESLSLTAAVPRFRRRDFAACFKQLQFLGREDARRRENATRKVRNFSSRCMQEKDSVSQTAEDSNELEYAIRITTSRESGSGLSQPESGVLVGLLGTDERFLLHKLDSKERQFEGGKTTEERVRGKSIGGIQSVWLSPVSGTWRPQSVSVLVNDFAENRREGRSSEVGQDESKQNMDLEASPSGTLYSFEWREGPIGEGCEHSAAQLALHGAARTEGGGYGQTARVSAEDLAALRDSGLAEYQELKTFLLGTTAALVGAGSLGSALAFGSDTSIGFAAGGSAGLLYLLLLQRTVDQLGGAVESSNSTHANQSAETSNSLFNRLLHKLAMMAKGPASRIVLIALIILVVAKASGTNDLRTVEPQQVVAGLAGFLVYKIAVLLAAFRPSKSTLNG